MLSEGSRKATEAALVGAARDGDREALQTLLDRHWNWLKALNYSILGNISDVEDALQELCVLVLDRIGTIREPERFRAWLATVARHNALAWRRRRGLERQASVQAAAVNGQDYPGDVLNRLVLAEEYRRLLMGLDGLPEKYREVFILRHMNDMSYADIAEILGLTVTTVQIRLVRARRMLANVLTGRPNHKVPRT